MDTVSIWDNKRVLEKDGDDGYTKMQMYLVLLNCKLKNDLNDKFYVMNILLQ